VDTNEEIGLNNDSIDDNRSFSLTGPCLWNSVPVALRDRDISLAQFKVKKLKLKTNLYSAIKSED